MLGLRCRRCFENSENITAQRVESGGGRMKNYGEELAYWYFRLNGFFLITDFVIHNSACCRASDIDILAVRFPFVSEEVGGQCDDWDWEFLAKLGVDKHKNEAVLGVICEVSTKQQIGNDVFDVRKLAPAVRRLGFFQHPETVEDVVNQLADRWLVEVPPLYEVAKVLITNELSIRKNYPGYYQLSLEHIDDFLSARINKYLHKHGDRMQFSSSMWQYMIWRVQREKNRQSN